ncbi:MAG TPA: LysM peptidoglycan-binding domain-containing protein, partial [Rhodothermales bacterium]|nr:LysM peptidoglycan-binding domain-containing protein [Rhodothermales bacterium]
EGAVADARALSQTEGVPDATRFREAYTAVMTEYEVYYDTPALDRGEIYAFRDALFAATETVDGPLLEDVNLPEDLGGNVAMIPMDMNRLVESAMGYLRRSTGHTSRIRTRSDTYFPMIERILAEEGVPDELKYLAVIESALNPRARSHAAAAGMWQFIQATGAAYDLRVTDDRDDRLDPEQATRAAARHLRDLHERFGDWHLALAGYNCNPNRIARAIASAESRLGRRATFWDIYDDIPRETRNYVPMFIATALIMSNPGSFGLPAAERGPAYVYDEVPVEPGTSLSALAVAAETDVDAIRALNPSFRRDRVPSATGGVRMVRIPVGSYTANAAQLDRFAPAGGSTNPLYAARTVRYGTRNGVALSAGSGDVMMASAAPRRSTERTAPRVDPTPERRTPPAARVDPTPERVAPNPDTESPPVVAVAETTTEPVDEAPAEEQEAEEPEPRQEARPTPAPTRTRTPARTTTHRVQRGDNLSAIASRYGVSIRQLREWNEIAGDNIRPGQRLRVSADAPGARTAAARSRTPQTITHRVTSGETLSAIARRYGVTIRQLRSWNSGLSDSIRPGQRIRVERSNPRG